MIAHRSKACVKQWRGKRFIPSLELLEDRQVLSQMVSGKVFAAGEPWANAQVTLFQTGGFSAAPIGTGQTDHAGRYRIQYNEPAPGTSLYLVASEGQLAGQQIYLSVAGEVGSSLQRSVNINELTTVASVYALSPFIDGVNIHGPSPGLNNAVATTFNLVNVQSGKAGAEISNHLNGASLHTNPRSTLALQTENTLANLLSACAADPAKYPDLFALTTVDGQAPTNTVQAILNIARHPYGLDNQDIFELATTSPVYTPMLNDVSEDWVWVLAMHFTQGGFGAPGRIAIDAQGNIWSNNNFMPGKNSQEQPGHQVTVLDPRGKPINGSPIFSRSVRGSGYGTAVAPDGTIWIANFGDSGITQFSPTGRELMHAPASLTGLDHPMGMTFDQQGNLWIPNTGDPTDPLDNGSVTVFLGGDPTQRRTYTHSPDPLVGLVRKPFTIAMDGHGRAWVTDGSGVAPTGNVTILELTANQEIHFVHQVTSPALSTLAQPEELHPYGPFMSTRTVAIDAEGNGWVSNFESHFVTFIDGQTFAATDIPLDPESHGWGVATDSGDQVFVASFSNPVNSGRMNQPPVISVVHNTGAGSELLYSFSNPALQHLTAVQLDASGNVWVVNNWSLETSADPLTVYGGDGLVQLIGLASPVATPLVGPPVMPAPQGIRAAIGNQNRLALQMDGLESANKLSSFQAILTNSKQTPVVQGETKRQVVSDVQMMFASSRGRDNRGGVVQQGNGTELGRRRAIGLADQLFAIVGAELKVGHAVHAFR